MSPSIAISGDTGHPEGLLGVSRKSFASCRSAISPSSMARLHLRTTKDCRGQYAGHSPWKIVKCLCICTTTEKRTRAHSPHHQHAKPRKPRVSILESTKTPIGARGKRNLRPKAHARTLCQGHPGACNVVPCAESGMYRCEIQRTTKLRHLEGVLGGGLFCA